MDCIGKLIDFAAAVIIMMLLPVLWGMGMEEKLLGRFAASRAQEFAEDVCFRGYISKERYELFLNALSAAGGAYYIDMECETTIEEPVYRNGVFTGTTEIFSSVCRSNDILDKVYTRGKCAFVSGSVFRIKIGRGSFRREISAVVS